MNRNIFRTNSVMFAPSAAFSFFMIRFTCQENEGRPSSNADHTVQKVNQLFRPENYLATSYDVSSLPKHFDATVKLLREIPNASQSTVSHHINTYIYRHI